MRVGRACLLTLLGFMQTLIPIACQQQTQATYNLTNALESTLLVGEFRVTGLTEIVSLTPLTATTVQADTCLAGTFSYADAQQCTACGTGYYSTIVTATTKDVCLACAMGKYSNLTIASSPTACTDCPANTYGYAQAVTLEFCLQCPANTWSYQGSSLITSCVCSPGYSGPNGARGWRVRKEPPSH